MTDAMRFEVEFSPGALNDLDEIASYMTQVRGEDDAATLAGLLMDRAETLATFRFRGAAPTEMLHLDEVGFRQILFRQYRIVYLVLGSTVRVVMVADGRRDMPALFRDRLGVDPPA